MKILLPKPQPAFNLAEKLPVYRQWAFDQYLTKESQKEETNICEAISNGDTSKCMGKYDCLAEYYFVKAHQHNDKTLCDNIETSYEFLDKEICVASITKDIARCNTITDQTNKQICTALVSADKTDCANLPADPARDCNDYIIMLKNAIPSNDISACQQIQLSFTREECNALLSKNSSLCTDERATYIAYAIIASEQKNSSFCDIIQFDDVKESCLKRLDCEFMKTKRAKQQCLQQFS